MSPRVAVAQMDCAVGAVDENLRTIDRLAERAAGLGAELCVFPECATTGYFIGDRLAELATPVDGPVMARLADIAGRHRCHLAVGVALAEEGRFFDALVLLGPDGERLGLYRKAHLFAAERRWYTPGGAPVVVETALGRLGLTICYDLIFPEYVRRLVALGADLIVNSTDWITDAYQSEVWGWSGQTVQALLTTRALENGVFVAMANRVGREESFWSLGWSSIASPSGQVLAAIEAGEGLAVATLALESPDLTRWRSVATYRADRRPELYGS